MAVSDNIVLPAQVGIEGQLLALAEKALGGLKNDMDVPDITAVNDFGLIDTVHDLIRGSLAKANKADLMVVGLYGCHGISHLLGSTVNAVLYHALGDILAMHIEE